MKKNINKFIAIGIIASSILVLNPIKASAEWRQDNSNGKWWYSQGITYAKGWLQDKDGKWYYFGQDGYMQHDTNVNGYQLGSDGAWIQNTNINSNNVTNTNDVNSNNTINSNNSTSINNYINNGTINNTNINNTNITNNYIYINNGTTTATDETAVKEKAFDGTNGFQQVGDNQYVYYEDGQMLTHTWKKFDNGYRYFDKDGYLDFSTTVNGLYVDEKGLYTPNDKNNDSIKQIFRELKPYNEYIGGRISGDLDYITNTYDVFGIKYEIEYDDVYDHSQDGQILEIDSSYGGKNDHWSEMNNDNFSAKKIIVIGKYASRLNLDD